jgi:hypothetical protein
MPYYISVLDRRVASTKGPCFTFKALEPIFINAYDATIPDVEAAGCLTVEQFQDVLKNAPDLSEYLETPEPPKPEESPLDFATEEDIEGEMRTLRYAEEERNAAYAAALAAEKQEEEKKLAAETLAAAEAELQAAKEEKEELEKSPAFDQVVFEAAVRDILDSGDTSLLTEKGYPKATAVKDLTGLDVNALKIVRFVKNMDK